MATDRTLQPKQSMTSFDIAAEISELAPKINGARVENVYQTDRKTILVRTRSFQIVAEAGRRLHSTRFQVKTPPQPTQFCRALRKYLNNAVVKSVTQPEFERIVVFQLENRGESYKLLLELFSRGNIILTDAEDKILQALEQRKMRDRSVVRGERLKPPPPSGLNPLRIALRDMEMLRRYGDQAVRVIARQFGLGGLYAEESLSVASVPRDTPSNRLTDQQLDDILHAITSLTTRLTENRLDPCIVVSPEGQQLDALPFRLSVYKSAATRQFSSFDEALDEYFTKQAFAAQTEGIRSEFESRLREQERILTGQKEELSVALREASEFRRAANSILERVNDLDGLLSHIRNQREQGMSWTDIEKHLKAGSAGAQAGASLIQDIDPSQRIVSVKLGDRVIQLDTRRTAYENVGTYFQRAKETEERTVGIRSAIKQTQNKFVDLNMAYTKESEPRAEPARRERREWYQIFHWCLSTEDFLIIGGRDANTNEVIVKKYARPADLVFHSDAPGAPFVVVRTEDREAGEQTIREAAELAASYSRAWRENAAAVDVYWVKTEQVSPQAPSGEYMAKGMFMIYGPRNYMRGIPLRVAIGVVFADGSPRAIGGPSSAVKSRTSVYVELVPGQKPSGELAKRIRAELVRRSPEQNRKAIAGLALEEIQAFIPAGRGEIALR